MVSNLCQGHATGSHDIQNRFIGDSCQHELIQIFETAEVEQLY